MAVAPLLITINSLSLFFACRFSWHFQSFPLFPMRGLFPLSVIGQPNALGGYPYGQLAKDLVFFGAKIEQFGFSRSKGLGLRSRREIELFLLFRSGAAAVLCTGCGSSPGVEGRAPATGADRSFADLRHHRVSFTLSYSSCHITIIRWGFLHIPAKRFDPGFRVDSRMILYHF